MMYTCQKVLVKNTPVFVVVDFIEMSTQNKNSQQHLADKCSINTLPLSSQELQVKTFKSL